MAFILASTPSKQASLNLIRYRFKSCTAHHYHSGQIGRMVHASMPGPSRVPQPPPYRTDPKATPYRTEMAGTFSMRDKVGSIARAHIA